MHERFGILLLEIETLKSEEDFIFLCLYLFFLLRIHIFMYYLWLQVAKLFSYTWTMGIFLCKAVHYMQSVSAICSVVTLTAMSIER